MIVRQFNDLWMNQMFLVLWVSRFYFYNNFQQKNKQKNIKMADNLTKFSQNRWSPQEQTIIKLFYEEKQIKSWKVISEAVNFHLKSCQLGTRRNSKQCRDRYVNYIKYDSSAGEISTWTQLEIKTMFQKYIEFGPRWTLIAKQISNRSENSIKNKFYNCLRKFSRKLNTIIRQNKFLKTKPLKYELIMKALEYSKVCSCLFHSDDINQKIKFDDYHGLRLKIIQNLQSFEQGCYKTEQIIQLLEQIIEFRKETKFVTLSKIHGAKTQSRCKNPQFIKEDDLSSFIDKIKSQNSIDQIELQAAFSQKKTNPQESCLEKLPESVIELQLQMIDENNYSQYRSPFDTWAFQNDLVMNGLPGQNYVSAFF